MNVTKKTTILLSALNCISMRGYESTRLQDVSQEAGLSIGLIQHYFGTRENLLSEALVHATDQLLDHFTKLAEEAHTPWQQISGMIAFISNMPDLRGRGLLWLELSSVVAKHLHVQKKLANVYESWDAHVRAAIERGVADGSFRVDGCVDDLVAIFLAFFDGYEFEIATGLVDNDGAQLQHRALLLARHLFHPTEQADT